MSDRQAERAGSTWCPVLLVPGTAALPTLLSASSVYTCSCTSHTRCSCTCCRAWCLALDRRHLQVLCPGPTSQPACTPSLTVAKSSTLTWILVSGNVSILTKTVSRMIE